VAAALASRNPQLVAAVCLVDSAPPCQPVVGPGRKCSKYQMMEFDSRIEGLKCVEGHFEHFLPGPNPWTAGASTPVWRCSSNCASPRVSTLDPALA